MGVRLGAILTDANARLGDGKQGRASSSRDALVDLVLLERTLLDPPRLAAMTRWVAQVRRRFARAELVAYAWHLVSHGVSDPIHRRTTRRLPGAPQAFGELQATPEAEQAWSVTRACIEALGDPRVVVRTPPAVSPGALGRTRVREFVARRRSEGIEVIWEPEGLWSPAEAVAHARAIGARALVPAFEGGRAIRATHDPEVLVAQDAWLRVDGVGPRSRIDADQIDAIAQHLERAPDATIVLAGPRAFANLRELAAALARD
jgi:hypothetical protein